MPEANPCEPRTLTYAELLPYLLLTIGGSFQMSVSARLKRARSSCLQDAGSHDLTRELGAFEHTLWATDCIEPHHFLLVVRLERLECASFDENRLRAALAAAQRRHPALRVRIACADGLPPRYCPVDLPIPLQVIRGCHKDDWRVRSVQELTEPVDADRGPLLRVCLLLGEDASHLILTVHHAIGDGASAAYLMREILEFGVDDARPALPALPARRSVEEIVTKAPDCPPPHGSHSTQMRATPRLRPTVTSFEIAPDILDALVQRSRLEQTTLQGALIAAGSLSFEGVSARILSPVNVRSHLPGIVDDFGLYIAAAITSLDLHAGRDFWQVAREARVQLTQARTLPALHRRVAATRSLLADSQVDADIYASYDSLRQELGYQAVLSNLGRFPDIVRPERGPYVSAAYLLLNGDAAPTVGIVTLGGRLSVTMTSISGADDAAWFQRFEFLLRSAGDRRS
ncbi:hypothetical protein LMG28614_07131 [Paraburkholderia ultramafica]|uniref:Condensation domain-containing protein n=1 Tax=Paraburkholderia ultramafica TaxID=1544867 RepID=A0A6S7C411_9BURK|nr:condensation domain-containing protein [Paraburkholderia ultramafica]CAB3809779.1 hypothetical protein LMG28614_07131 [Paraburkholderia ultramafica]